MFAYFVYCNVIANILCCLCGIWQKRIGFLFTRASLCAKLRHNEHLQTLGITMVQNLRHDEILTLAREQGKVTVEMLARHFDVTTQTIRRDLSDLCDSGNLSRVHGGAILPSGVVNMGYEERTHLATNQKAALARMCADQIPNGASLFLNIGTTTEAVARALLNHKNLLVITNNINVANILATTPHSEIILAGGVLRRSDGGLVGDMAAEIIRQFRVDYAVIGTAAIAEDGVLLDYDFREVRVTQAIIQNSRKRFLVADAIKFTRHAPVRIAEMSDMTAFFTDRTPPEKIGAMCREHGVKMHIAGSDGVTV